jgi:cobalt-precorrin 5A hydrolase
MAVIGIGTTSRVTVEDVLAIIAAAKAKIELDPGARDVDSISTLDRDALNHVLYDAARQAGLSLLLLQVDQLKAAAKDCLTHSEKSQKLYGVPSVAEAAALAAAGANAKLLIPRFCGRNTTASVAIAP